MRFAFPDIFAQITFGHSLETYSTIRYPFVREECQEDEDPADEDYSFHMECLRAGSKLVKNKDKRKRIYATERKGKVLARALILSGFQF